MVSDLKTLASSSFHPADEASKSVVDIDDYVARFEAALSDDINTPRAVATLFNLITALEKALNSKTLTSPIVAKSLLEAIERMDSVLGLFYQVPTAYFSSEALQVAAMASAPIPEDIFELARRRVDFKSKKMFAEADDMRRQITEAGYAVKDLKGGEFELTRL